MQTASLLRERFESDGYVVHRGLVSAEVCAAMVRRVRRTLKPLQGPAEYEAEVGYPGSPADRDGEGGDTPRRLLHAYSRHQDYRDFATSSAVRAHLSEMLGGAAVALSQCHHNCIMTKHPGYSSATLWHQDIRYWSFDRPELVSTWLALGFETPENGALKVIPGSHRIELDRGRLDRDLFLRPEIPANRALLEAQQTVALDPGDVLFFHCRLFHAAGRNDSDALKASLVFTYHAVENRPIPGTRSAQYPSIDLEVVADGVAGRAMGGPSRRSSGDSSEG